MTGQTSRANVKLHSSGKRNDSAKATLQRQHKLTVASRMTNKWSRTFRRYRFIAAVSSRGHFVAIHFVAGTLRRHPFCCEDTSSPSIS